MEKIIENIEAGVKAGIKKSKETLRPCPFCGIEEDCETLVKLPPDIGDWEKYKPIIERISFLREDIVITCQNCGASVLTYTKDKEEAIELWNMRA